MITRVFKGQSPYGLVRYLYGEGRRNEHTGAHAIASWDGNPAALEPNYIAQLRRHDVAPLVALLEQPMRGCDRVPEKWVYHLVLRNAPEDRRLSDEEWAQVCTSAMDRTGIAPTGDPAGCRWIAVRHADDHVHVVATLAREDGRAPRIWGDYAKLGHVAQDYEQQFGLRPTAARDQTAALRPGVKEQVTAERARRESPRVALRRKVQAAAASSRDFAEFATRLRGDGVTVRPRMSERDPDQMTGYSVSLDDWTNAAGEPVRFGGGKLAPDLSWPKLRARWPDRADAAPTAAAAPGRDAAHGPKWGADADAVWREAERIVHDAAGRIRDDAARDPAAAADAAWAASDTLAAAADGLEGADGGPLSAAADALHRAGRETYRQLPTPTDTGTALRAVGRMVAAITAGNRQPAARVAALSIALATLAAAVAELRTAQRRLHQAEAARDAAEQLRHIAPVSARAASEHTGSRRRTAADVADLSTGTTRFRPTPVAADTKSTGPDVRPPTNREPGPRRGL